MNRVNFAFFDELTKIAARVIEMVEGRDFKVRPGSDKKPEHSSGRMTKFKKHVGKHGWKYALGAGAAAVLAARLLRNRRRKRRIENDKR